jgi:DNA adenine methylase
MKWLVTLLNPVAGMKTLDPFMGSGSTGKAAVALKELDLHFTGIDLDPEFCEISEKRIVDMLNRVHNGAQFSPAKEIKEAPETRPLKKTKSSTQETQIANEQVSKATNVKWFGGLGQSTKQIKSLLPKCFNRYIEPLSGNGSLIFDLENKRSVINDPNREFVAFHELLQSSNSTKLVDYIERVQNERDSINQSVLQCVSPESLINQFKSMCSNPSFEHFLKLEIGKLKPNSDHTVIKTTVHQALYYSYRDSYNQKRDSFCVEHISTWFVLRELAYSGMVRFNKQGKFNVPYGKNLNSKDLISRLKNIIQRANEDFYKEVTFSHSDIEHFFNQHNNVNQSDFIFFNATAMNAFEHSKILELSQIKSAKTMLIVKNNPDIRSLYSQDFNVFELSSKYLVITNYGHQGESISSTQLLSYEMKEAA